MGIPYVRFCLEDEKEDFSMFQEDKTKPYSLNLLGITEEEYAENSLYIQIQPFYSLKHLKPPKGLTRNDMINAHAAVQRQVIETLKRDGKWIYPSKDSNKSSDI